MYKYITLLICLCCSWSTWAQTKAMEQEWQAIVKKIQNSSFDNNSALVSEIKDLQLRPWTNDKMIRLKVWEIQAQPQKIKSNAQSLDSAVKSILGTLSDPIDKAVANILMADYYISEYENNKYKILHTTANAIANTNIDMHEWTVTEYQHVIVNHIDKAFADTALLKNVPVKKYWSLFTDFYNEVFIINNTMYDALLWKAVDIFKNDISISTAISDYNLVQSNHLKPYPAFNNLIITHDDEHNFKYRRVKTLQTLSRYYSAIKNDDGVSIVDRKRLEFFNQDQLPDEQIALIDWNKAHFELPTIKSYWEYHAIKFQLAQRAKLPHGQQNLKPLYDQLEQIIQRYPYNSVFNEAAATIQELKKTTFNTQVEDVVLPNVNNKFLLSHKNLKHIYLYIYKNVSKKEKEPYDDYKKRVISQTPVKQSVITLSQPYPYELHTTEIKLDPLKYGQYVLVTSDNYISNNTNNFTFRPFQVSDLMVISIGQDKSQVVSRTTGKAIAKAHILDTQNNKNTATTDALGYVNVASKRYNDNFKVVYGKDELYKTNINGISDNDDYDYQENILFLFTDRSIYRPGQKVYYKGIAVLSKRAQSSTHVEANKKFDIEFKNANNEVIQQISLTTNEFGSFTGSFDIPEEGLNGRYRIHKKGTWQGVDIQVEEYKRPNFYINYDTLNQTYTLSKPIVVKGKAVAYAGSNISDAEVTYTVKRDVNFPYFWRKGRHHIPYQSTVEIAEGTTVTGTDGSFSITFVPKEDESINKDLWPVYTYTINAEITDITGETHEKQIVINAAQADLIINAEIPSEVNLQDLKKVKIITTNVNEIQKQTNVAIKVYKLIASKELLAERRWEAPNAPLYDAAEFKTLFPNDAYGSETNPSEMPLGELVLTQTMNSNGTIDLSKVKENGYYFISISAIENGQTIEQKYYYHLYDKSLNGSIEAPLILTKNSKTFQPGDTIKWQPIAKDPNTTLWSHVSTLSKRSISKASQILVQEDDRGGISIQNYFVKNNRFYLVQDEAQVPWTNKQLQIKWATHRDKLLPGSKETWQFTISGSEKEKVAAEMMATLYDASLDDLKQHQWNINALLENVSIPYISAQNNGSSMSNTVEQFPNSIKNNYAQQSYVLSLPSIHPDKHIDYNRIVTRLQYAGAYNRIENLEGTTISSPYSVKTKKIRSVGSADRIQNDEASGEAIIDKAVREDLSNIDLKSENTQPSSIPVRSNFNETAFFAPQLHTDQNGDIVYSFKLPESLTKWNLKTIAHTKDWRLGQLSGSIQTQKDVMVIPNVPRYFRQGDEVVFSTKVANLTNKKLPVTAQLDILDANTLQSLNTMFGLNQTAQSTSVDAEGNVAVNWTLRVPESRYEPVIIRVTAQAGDHTDGEEHTLPVITNRTFVTASSMLYMNGNGEKIQTFDAMLQAIKSPTVSNYKMTLEYVTNPTWYVVQALPYLTTYPYECAEQIFSKFYGNAMSMHIVNQSPAIQAMLKTWQKDSTSFDSKLAQNEGLKTALLEETPWVTEAKNKKAQQQDILRLLDTKARSKELSENLNRLSQLQLSDGGFGWFKGHYSNPYITRTILHGLVRMKHINVSSYNQEKATYIVNRAYSYLDKELKNEYEALIKNKIKLDNNNLSYNVIHYLYTRSYEKPALSKSLSPIHTYFINQEKQYWTKYNPYMQGMIALTLHRNGEQTKAKEIVESLRQRAIKNDELGMYWNTNKNYYYWYEAPIEQQAVLIEAFQTIDPRSEEIALMQTYLFKNKQTNRWHSTKATVDATYAILNNNEDLLNAKPEVALGVSNLWLQTKEQENNPLGYYQSTIMGTDIKPEHANISLKVSNAPHSLPSWGAVYYQYFENTDKIAAAKSAISITKELFILKHTDKGQVLEKNSDNRPLQIGDKVRVKLVVRTDRDLEYVHIKDARAACLEPKDVLSEYKTIGNVGAYQQTGDISTSFFIDHLSKGTYVLEYDTYVNAKGTYSSGIATAQCMYAPEVIGNSKGESIIIK